MNCVCVCILVSKDSSLTQWLLEESPLIVIRNKQDITFLTARMH